MNLKTKRQLKKPIRYVDRDVRRCKTRTKRDKQTDEANRQTYKRKAKT